MAIDVHIPYALRHECGGAAELRINSAPTVRAALDQLEVQYPAIYRSVCHENGELRRHINLFVNLKLVPRGAGLKSALNAGDKLTIMTAVSGG